MLMQRKYAVAMPAPRCWWIDQAVFPDPIPVPPTTRPQQTLKSKEENTV